MKEEDITEVEKRRQDGCTMKGMISERVREVQVQERRKKIRKSRYNRWYERLEASWLPRYLMKKRRGQEAKIIARFRCGNQKRGNRVWKAEAERMYDSCGNELHILEHMEREK